MLDPDLIMQCGPTVMPIDPKTKTAYDLVKSGDAFDRSFEQTAAAAAPLVESIVPKLADVPTEINGVAPELIAQVTGIESQVTGALSGITDFASHVTDQFDDIMGKATTFASAQAMLNGLSGNLAGGCDAFTSFFGSITTLGPGAINSITALAGQVKSEIDNFISLGATLQGQITGAKDGLLNAINGQIASVTDPTKLASLNSVKSAIENEFQSGIAEVRADLTNQAMALLPTNVQSSVQGVVDAMKTGDLNINTASNAIATMGGQITQQAGGLLGMATGEADAMQAAVDGLETLGDVGSMQSLMGTNPCIQTLMGFVATSPFLKAIGS